ncbi:branched-chain amino acid ABC transporter permease [Patescibacteria group bacterium]|nr:branched-chain amino acid ABC transporter permease [Patescibacteria group bacterium]
MSAEVFASLLIYGITVGVLYGVVASGLGLIYGVMRILNIAHGTLLMIGAFGMFWLFDLWGITPLWSILVVTPLLAIPGFILYKIIVSPIGKAGSVELRERSTLIAFFGVLIVIENSCLLLWTAEHRTVTYLRIPLDLVFVNINVNRLVILGVSIAIIGLLHLYLTRTYMGKAIRAVTQDQEAGMMMGVNAEQLTLYCFAISTALAGVAGSLVGILSVINPLMGFPFLIRSFVVMIIGGTANVKGWLYAGVVLGIAEFIGAYFLGEGYREAIAYIILVVFLVLASRGYLARWRR